MAPAPKPCILVTRPAPAGQVLCERLAQAGFHAIFFPTIAFMPLAYHPHEGGDPYWLIFTSPQAVTFASPIPPALRYAAVGSGTAAALLAAGIDALYPPENPGSEGLLAILKREVSGKVIIVTGRNGRPYLRDTLRAWNIDVSEWIVYERVLPAYASLPFDLSTKIDRVICTSVEGVRNLKILLESRLGPRLYDLPLLVTSVRIKALAEVDGFKRIWMAHDASHDAILAALSSQGTYHERCESTQ